MALKTNNGKKVATTKDKNNSCGTIGANNSLGKIIEETETNRIVTYIVIPIGISTTTPVMK